MSLGEKTEGRGNDFGSKGNERPQGLMTMYEEQEEIYQAGRFCITEPRALKEEQASERKPHLLVPGT